MPLDQEDFDTIALFVKKNLPIWMAEQGLINPFDKFVSRPPIQETENTVSLKNRTIQELEDLSIRDLALAYNHILWLKQEKSK